MFVGLGGLGRDFKLEEVRARVVVRVWRFGVVFYSIFRKLDSLSYVCYFLICGF